MPPFTQGPPSPDSQSDQSLLRRYQNGETDAATAIYLRYAQRLLRLARVQTGRELAVRVDADDVVQSVFRTFFRRAAEGHYQIPDGEELWKLFLVIALNKIRGLGEYHRAAKRNVGMTTQIATTDPAQTSGGSSDEQAYRILRLTVEDLLEELPKVQRTMVTLRIDGHDIHAISQQVNRSKRSVERVLQNFRKRLSSDLNEV